MVGSPYDIPSTGRLGIDVWWHNRIGMPGRPGPGWSPSIAHSIRSRTSSVARAGDIGFSPRPAEHWRRQCHDSVSKGGISQRRILTRSGSNRRRDGTG